jgi:hypothetical protein
METGSQRLRRQPRIPGSCAMSESPAKAPKFRGFRAQILPRRPEIPHFWGTRRVNRAPVSGREFKMSGFGLRSRGGMHVLGLLVLPGEARRTFGATRFAEEPVWLRRALVETSARGQNLPARLTAVPAGCRFLPARFVS